MKLSPFKSKPARPRPCRGRFLGMDWGGRYVQFALAEHTLRGTRIRRLLKLELPPDMVTGDPQAMGQWLAQQIHSHRLNTSSAVMIVPRSKAILKPLRLPEVADEGELAGMVQYQVLRDSPYKREEAVIDFFVGAHYQSNEPQEDIDQNTQDVLSAVIHRREVEYYQAVADAAGLKLNRLGLRPFADVRSVQELIDVSSEEHFAIVHLATDSIEIGVMTGGSLEFCRSSDLTLPRSEDCSQAGQFDDAMAQTADSVVNTVVQNLQIYSMSHARRDIDRLLVIGATGLEQRVAEQVYLQLGIPLQSLAVDRALGIKRDADHAPACLSAIGAALMDGDADGTPFDFAHPRQPAVPRTKLQQYGPLAGIAAALVIVPLVVWIAIAFASKHSELNTLRQEISKLKTAEKQVKVLEREVKELDAWAADGEDWLDQWAYLCSMLPSEDQIYLQGINTSGDNRLTFTAMAKNPSVISEMADRLQQAGYDYQPERTESRPNGMGYGYTLVARVMPTSRVSIDMDALRTTPRPQDDISLNQYDTEKMPSLKTIPTPPPIRKTAEPAAADSTKPETPTAEPQQSTRSSRPTPEQITAYKEKQRAARKAEFERRKREQSDSAKQ